MNPPTDMVPNLAPESQVTFIHPELPILQVVSVMARPACPTPLDPEVQQGLDPHDMASNVKDLTRKLPRCEYVTMVFNLALQRRWDKFDEPRRDIIQYAAAYRDYPELVYRDLSGQERCELDPAMDDLYPNYWHPTDYMHHSVLGPVAVIIWSYNKYNEPVVNSGTYWVDLPRTEWAADPSVSSPETARIAERPLSDSENDGWPLPGHKVIGTEDGYYTPR